MNCFGFWEDSSWFLPTGEILENKFILLEILRWKKIRYTDVLSNLNLEQSRKRRKRFSNTHLKLENLKSKEKYKSKVYVSNPIAKESLWPNRLRRSRKNFKRPIAPC